MDQIKWKTPSKIGQYGSPSKNSPKSNMTPIKQHETRTKHITYQDNTGCFTFLPSYITPPSGLTKIIRRNPFEADLTSRLHLPMISPTVFSKVSSSSQQSSPEFKWNIDELAQIKPVKIEEFPMQQTYSPDPEVEKQAQAAIDRFFKENQIIPSPWDIKNKENKSYNVITPCRPSEDMNSIKELFKIKKDAWSQTVLSFPVNLPENVEEALKPFSTFTQEQNMDNEEINLSNSSLRRQLFANLDECLDNDNVSFISSSPVETNESMLLTSSPPQSGMLIHSTLKGSLQQTRRHSGRSECLSSPYMSPIHNEKHDISCKNFRHNSHSTFQLDFAVDMSVDNIDTKESKHFNDGEFLDVSWDTYNMKCTDDNHKTNIVNNDKTNLYNHISMEPLSKCTNTIDNTVHFNSILFDNKDNNVSLKSITEIEKNSIYGSHKQSDTMLGTFDRPSISNSVQDTGYQTYSMDSTMQMTESYNNISTNKVHSSGLKVTFKDDAQLSWKEDLRSVFSSTPSKCNKRKES